MKVIEFIIEEIKDGNPGVIFIVAWIFLVGTAGAADIFFKLFLQGV
jgi:hypothetical protein